MISHQNYPSMYDLSRSYARHVGFLCQICIRKWFWCSCTHT